MNIKVNQFQLRFKGTMFIVTLITSEEKQKEIRTQVDALLKLGVIKEASHGVESSALSH